MVKLCPLSQIGAVELGIKPAELVKLGKYCKKCLTDRNLFLYKLARGFFLFYNQKLLKQVLEIPCAGEILLSLGYSLKLEDDLQLLKTKFVKRCPSEIGFFLGYPPKDVLGFMGYSGFIYSHTLGWQIFYPALPSESLYYQYKNAKKGSYRCCLHIY